ncbi:hypothetical protein [Paenibacillus sp. VTT E-133291]|uniref:hypothetical protein n=1 Tax=Paenibacillus sp. VTT E-133291 TaxID=1986223 RepID=UPI000BA05785|nr:hypothetical protein [Paenibacillus sp. VTT E-133291]OZQ97354.1 hypothetical protein CA598_06060 [Paenibacillus sp. VTT E-133291]
MRSIKAIFLIAFMLLLSSCSISDVNPVSSQSGDSVEEEKSPLEGTFRTEYMGDGERGWVLYDNQTGCQYIALSASTAYTPRLNSHGIPMCNDTQ